MILHVFLWVVFHITGVIQLYVHLSPVLHHFKGQNYNITLGFTRKNDHIWSETGVHHLADSLQLPGRAETRQCWCGQRNKPSEGRSYGPEMTQNLQLRTWKLAFSWRLSQIQWWQDNKSKCREDLLGHALLPGPFYRQASYLTEYTVLVSQTVPCRQNYRPPHWTLNPPLLNVLG